MTPSDELTPDTQTRDTTQRRSREIRNWDVIVTHSSTTVSVASMHTTTLHIPTTALAPAVRSSSVGFLLSHWPDSATLPRQCEPHEGSANLTDSVGSLSATAAAIRGSLLRTVVGNYAHLPAPLAAHRRSSPLIAPITALCPPSPFPTRSFPGLDGGGLSRQNRPSSHGSPVWEGRGPCVQIHTSCIHIIL